MTPEQGSPRNLMDADVLSVYASLEELLLTDAGSWKEFLFDPLSEHGDEDSEELAKAVANWCYHHEQGGNFITSKVVPYEIERTQSLALLLRGESFSSRVLLEYGKLVGWTFLRKAVKSIVKRLVQKGVGFEVDPTRLTPALNHSASDSLILPRSKSTGELPGDCFVVTSSPSAPCLGSTLHEEPPQSPTQPKKFSQLKRGRGSRIGSRLIGQEAPSNASTSSEEEQTESTEEIVELRGSRIALRKLDFSTLPRDEPNEEILLTRLRAETTGNEQATEERKQSKRSGSRSGSRVEFSNSESTDEKKRSGGSRIRSGLYGLQHSNPADEGLTELDKNRNNLMATANLVLDAFVTLTSAETVPPELRDLCMSIHEASNQKFPTSGYTAVSGLLFLRYLCPAIVSPRQHGLVNPDPIKPKVQRSLILLAKLLQAAASQTLFDPEKEAYMLPFNSWLISSRPQIEVIYANILRIAKDEKRLTSSGSNLIRRLRKSPSTSTIPGSRLPHIALIYRHILKVMASNSPRKSSNENLERVIAELKDNLLLHSARIDLSDQELDFEQATELAQRIQQFGIETVREVDLRNNRIQGEGLQTLLTTLLTPTSGVEKLDLSGCELRRNDLKVLTRLVQQNSSLQEVILDESLIEDPTVLPSIESILASNRKKLNHSGGAIKRRISSIAKHVFGVSKA